MTSTQRLSRPATPRQVADAYVDAVCELDPIVATSLGTRPGDDRLPDPSPAGLEAEAALTRETLAELDRVLAGEPVAGRRPDRAELRAAAARAARCRARRARGGRGAAGPVEPVQPGALDPPGLQPHADGHRRGLVGRRPPHGAGAGGVPGLPGEPRGGRPPGAAGRAPAGAHRRRPAGRVAGRPVLRRLRRHRPRRRCATTSPRPRTPPTRPSPRSATSCATSTRRCTEGTPDAVGRDRYATAARRWTGSDLGAGQGLEEAYAWGWAEHRRILAEQRVEAEKVLPGRDPDGGHALAGHERPRRRGRGGDPRPAAADDGRRHRGDGRHALRPRRAGAPGRGDDRPAGQRGRAVLHAAGAGLLPAGPHLAADARPHPLPALGPRLDLVPRGRSRPSPAAGPVGLRLAAAVDLPDVAGLGRRERRGLGAVRRAAHGRARLLHRPRRAAGLPRRAAAARRCGWSSTSACTSGCRSPTTPRARSPTHRGQPWTPELARAFLGENSGADLAFLDSELVRYLGIPGQAISYKLGERAWLEGREAARQARGADFDLKAWHMAALSQGSLGLDDLAAELARL